MVANEGVGGITKVRLTRSLISQRKWKGRRMIPRSNDGRDYWYGKGRGKTMEWCERGAGFETY